MDGTSFPPGSGPWAPAPGGGPAAASPSLRQVEFVSEGGRFLKLLMRGAALELATFGFYRFWLATDMRRHLWSHTVVDGENAEYTGTGRELLIGFLFALAILLPIYLLYFLAGVEAERLQAFASIPLGLFMLLFGQFAIYRARRYRLTRTIWRGVRFWMTGSGWKYAFVSFGWMILVTLTLGALYPWRAAALERYKMAHTHYGDLQGAFDARPGDFFKRGLGMWLFFICGLVALAVGGAMTAGVSSGTKTAGVVLMVIGVIALIVTPFLYPYFKALEWRWWANGIELGGTRLQCTLRGGQLLKLFFKYLAIVWLVTSAAAMLVFAVGAVIAEAMGVSFKDISENKINELFMSGSWGLIALIVVGYLAIAMVAGVVQRFFMQHEYWKLITSTITVVKPEAMENVSAKGELAHALGEGLADGLDVAGF